jgi:hypothetical protein
LLLRNQDAAGGELADRPATREIPRGHGNR